MDRHICMIAYTTYSTDARVRREAETVAALTPYRVSVLVLRERAEPRTYLLDGVEVKELDIPKYRGKSALQYLLSYVRFLMLAFFECTVSLWKSPPDLIHIHNMPNFLIFAAILPRLFGRKIILDIHDTLIETYSTKFTGVWSRVLRAVLAVEEFVCCKLASRIVCVNSMQRQALVNRGLPDRKLTVVMNLPDP